MTAQLRVLCLPIALLCGLNLVTLVVLLHRPADSSDATTATAHGAAVNAREPAAKRMPTAPSAQPQQQLQQQPPPIQSIHLADFAYLHWPAACRRHAEPPLLLLGAVLSGGGQLATRRLLRRLYMSTGQHQGFGLRWVFVLAGGSNATLQTAIDREAARFGDIIQLSFRDAYENLTLKTLAAIDWAAAACPGALFFLKTDTDSMVNPFRLVEFLASLRLSEAHRLYAGVVPDYLEPLRGDIWGKWRISQKDYPLLKFPPYAVGGGYLLSRAALLQVLQASDAVFPFHLEDVYVGLCASRAGLVPSHRPQDFIMKPISHADWCNYHQGIVIHYVQQASMPVMWHHMTAPASHNPSCHAGPASQAGAPNPP